MTAGEQITMECPRCGATFEVWPQSAPVLGFDPAQVDPVSLTLAAHALLLTASLRACSM